MELYVTILAAIAFIIIFCYWQDTSLVVTDIVIENRKLPQEFDGYKIVQISDLHNARFGKRNGRLLKRMRAERPDIIVVTGDVYDRRRPNLNVAEAFLSDAALICPVYYISGNHENWSGFYPGFKMMIKDSGVTVLDDLSAELTKNGASIGLYGAADSSTNKKRRKARPHSISEEPLEGSAGMKNTVNEGMEDTANMESVSLPNSELLKRTLERLKEGQRTEFNILLSHRPELFPVYASQDFDLVFCGHAHGGQFRIPFIGGIYAPNQGFFPPFTSGVHTSESGTSMVVSRGLGNSQMPIRIFNRPEIISVTLKTEKNMV